MRTAFTRTLLALVLMGVCLALFLFGQPALGLLFAALLALTGAWILTKRVAKRPAVAAEVPLLAPSQANWVDVLWLCTQQIAKSKSLDDALLEVSRLLESELGALGVRAVRVEPNPAEAAWVRVIDPAYAEIEGYRPVAVSVPMNRFPLGAAIAEQTVVGDEKSGYAAPVCSSGQTVAVLEIHSITLCFTHQSLQQFLGILASQLAHHHATESARLCAAQLNETQEVLQQFADTVQESLFITNAQRSEFYFLAGGLFDVWGVTRDRIKAQPDCLLNQVVDEDKAAFAQRMVMERSGQADDFAFRIDHPTKGLRWLRSRTRTVVNANGESRVYGTVCDVTEDKTRETELRSARDAAEAASMAKSRFLANMSHEIRTPMNGILGMTELLLGTALQDNQKRFAQAVYRSGESLLEIINAILDFSNIESGKLELAPTDFSLRGVVEDTLELLAPRAHEKGLDISFREEPGMPAGAHGDALRVRQVLTNLIANAIKFTQQGEVVVDLRRIAKDESNEFWVEFSIRDTGIGIEPDKLPLLFSPFTQVSSDMSRRYGGTGLGLTISKQLVEIMGGRLSVVSVPGQGSQFSFTLPLQPARCAMTLASKDDDQMPALRVLVVDDHASNRAIMKNMLGAWGMIVTLAEDGQQALDMLCAPQQQNQPFDLALVDMHMPRLDGMALARAVKDRGVRGAMHMVLLSSVSSPDEARAALSAGFQRFLPKPVRKAELRQTIAALWSATGETADGTEGQRLLSGNVLVVEDNSVNQEVIGQMLRSWGLHVQIASGAMVGLRLLCEAHFDLVLMDIMMPGMDGIEAVRWFRRGSGARFQFKTPSTTPVIAVTANALEGDEERFLSLGFNDYLSKPFRQNQLFTMLTRYLRHQAMMTASAVGLDSGGSLSVPPEVETPPTSALSPTATWETVLDRTALERLGELDPNGQNKLMQRVVSAFETSVSRMVPQVQQASINNDRDGMRHVAHTLKSSSASIGALRLSKMCADLEALIRLERSDDTTPHVDRICREIEVVLTALRELGTVATTFTAAAKGQSIGTST